MTSPLSPEAVAQMVADREAAYQSYLNEITTNGNSRLDNIILSLSGNEVQQRHIATQIDMAFQAGWHHMLTSLSAENATLRAERDALRAERDAAVAVADDLRLRVEIFDKAGRVLQRERDALRASEAAAMARVTVLEAALQPLAIMAERYDPDDGDDGQLECWSGLAVPKIHHLRAARQAITPTADKEPKT